MDNVIVQFPFDYNQSEVNVKSDKNKTIGISLYKSDIPTKEVACSWTGDTSFSCFAPMRKSLDTDLEKQATNVQYMSLMLYQSTVSIT